MSYVVFPPFRAGIAAGWVMMGGDEGSRLIDPAVLCCLLQGRYV